MLVAMASACHGASRVIVMVCMFALGSCLPENGCGHEPVADCAPHDLEGCTTQCEKGSALSCGRLGAMYDEGFRVSEDVKYAATLYRRACDSGVAFPCRALALLHQSGRGVEQDDTRAARLYEQSCNGADEIGCNNLGVF